jgi:hypothetical protein
VNQKQFLVITLMSIAFVTTNSVLAQNSSSTKKGQVDLNPSCPPEKQERTHPTQLQNRTSDFSFDPRGVGLRYTEDGIFQSHSR